jgi:RNA polymerase sigma-70 factor (ECF subfamily)
VVALNRVVAVAEVACPRVALAELNALGDTALDGYHYLPALRADLLRRLGRTSDAIVAYQEALRLTENQAEQQFLREQITALAEVPLGPGDTEGWD